MRYNGKIDVYEDDHPTSSTTGLLSNGSAQGSSINNNSTIRPAAGARYFSLIIKAKTTGRADLTIEAADGSHVTLDLTNLTVTNGGGGDDD